MEPTEAQYLVINALETLGLLEGMVYDEERRFYFISSISSVLPIAILLPNGEIVPTSWVSDL
jgi:nucleoside-diphosphate-sugar epimerase